MEKSCQIEKKYPRKFVTKGREKMVTGYQSDNSLIFARSNPNGIKTST